MFKAYPAQELPNLMDPKQLCPARQSLSLWQTHTLPVARELFSVRRGLGTITGAQLRGQTPRESSALGVREDLPYMGPLHASIPCTTAQLCAL